MLSKRTHLLLSITLITLLSLWFRISYIQKTVVDIPIRGDAYHYVQYAKNLSTFGVFSKHRAGTSPPKPDSYWAPGYPAFLAGAIIVGDKLKIDPYILTLYVQAVIGTLTAILTLLLGRLFLSNNWSFISALLVSLSPHLISMGGYILTETLFTFMLMAALYLFSKAFFTQKSILFAFSGLFFGLSYLVNPIIFFAPIFLVFATFIFYIKNEDRGGGFKLQLITCLVVFFVISGAWSLRNSISVPPEQASGADRLITNLIIGSHSNFYDIWRADPRDPKNPATIDQELIGDSYSAFAGLLAERIADDPLHYAKWYLLDKPVLLWSWNILTGQGDIYVFPVKRSFYEASGIAYTTHATMKSLHYFLFCFSILGILFLFKKSPYNKAIPIFLYITSIYVSAVYVVTQSEPRYSIPLRPEMYLCAVFFVSQLVEYTKKVNFLSLNLITQIKDI